MLSIRLAELALGHTVTTLILGYAFDYVLYPFVIANGWWALACFGGIEAVSHVWQWLATAC